MTDASPKTTDTPASEFLNRDLQWLRFNERVLYQATDERLPLLERVRFLSIFATNLDEFFMKRVGGLRRQIEAGVDYVGGEGISPTRMLWSLREAVIPQNESAAACFLDDVKPALAAEDIHLRAYRDLDADERDRVDEWYRRNVFPLLTPLAVDPGHRFPFISNLSRSLGVMLRRPDDEEALFARVKIPETVESWRRIDEDPDDDAVANFVELSDIIENNLEDLFPGMQIIEVLPFRVTRNADVEGDDDDAGDLLDQIQAQLRERRFAPVVRLQFETDPSPKLLTFLCEAMEVNARDIYATAGPLDLSNLSVIADLPWSRLRFRSWKPVEPPRLADPEQDIFAAIRQGDILVHHPYESFDDSVERLIEAAASDPNVLGIKQALYRTSGDSAFVQSLIHAANQGKQVAVLVELRARFDEARNIRWARTLEDAGVHVAYGVVGLKTHTKICLVVRRDHDGLRCYSHIGTGNYNSSTARVYEDLGVFTCDPAFTDDVVELFNYMTGRSHDPVYGKLLVAPSNMKQTFIELIDREIELHGNGAPGRIIAKMNQLQDRTIIRRLYAASQAGVQIDLMVRGFCTLRPGVPGMSENIRVTSVVGRFLEHSRIFHFGGGHDDPIDGDWFIGSADWMYRNLHNRVEAITPIETRAHRERLWQIVQTGLSDERSAWDMQPDGDYVMRRPAADADPEAPSTIGTHRALMRMARTTPAQS